MSIDRPGGPPYRTFGRSRSLRLPGIDYSSHHAYFVTIGIRDRLSILSDSAIATVVQDQLLSCAGRHDYALHAYCLMPDHCHLLTAPNGESPVPLPRFVGAFKSLSTRAYWELGGSGSLWQRHYYDHVVRSDEALSALAEYIVNNPVRRGIVADADQYPFAGIAVGMEG